MIENLSEGPDCKWHQYSNKKFPYDKRVCCKGLPSTGYQINIDIGACDGIGESE